jgi:hypothetical protein
LRRAVGLAQVVKEIMDLLPFNDQEDLIIKDPKVFRYLMLSLPVSQKIVENVIYSILYKYQGNLFILYHIMRELKIIFGVKEPVNYMDFMVNAAGNGQITFETDESTSRLSDYDNQKAKRSRFLVGRSSDSNRRSSKRMMNLKTEESEAANDVDKFMEYVNTFLARDLKANILKIKQACFGYFKKILLIFELVCLVS